MSDYALIIGIETYETPHAQNLQGPSLDALRFASWLRDRGVVAANIILIHNKSQKWHGELEKEYRRVQERAIGQGVERLGEPTYGAITEAWRDRIPKLRAPAETSTLWIYWSGHGVAFPERREALLCSDFKSGDPTYIYLSELRDSLRSEQYGGFREQRLIVDACSTRVKYEDLGIIGRRQPELFIEAGAAQQILLHAVAVGETAKAEEGGSLFTRTLLKSLENAGDWPEEPKKIVGFWSDLTEAIKNETKGKCPRLVIDSPRLTARWPYGEDGQSPYDWPGSSEMSVMGSAAKVLDLLIGYGSEEWFQEFSNLQSSLKGPFSRQVGAQDVQRLVDIALEINPNHPQRERLALIYREWHAINPNVFRFVCSSATIIGFTSVIPLTEEGFRQYREGRLSEWDFGSFSRNTGNNYIEPVEPLPHRNICIQAIKLKPAYWMEKAKPNRSSHPKLRALIATLVEHLSLLDPFPFDFAPQLIADAEEKGLRMLESHGFSKINDISSAEGRPMYEFDLSQPDIWHTERSRIWAERLRILMAIEGALHILRHYAQRRLTDTELVILSWDMSEIINAQRMRRLPTWELYVVAAERRTVSVDSLQIELRATIRLTTFTTTEFSHELDRGALHKKLQPHNTSIVSCSNRNLARRLFSSSTRGEKRG